MMHPPVLGSARLPCGASAVAVLPAGDLLRQISAAVMIFFFLGATSRANMAHLKIPPSASIVVHPRMLWSFPRGYGRSRGIVVRSPLLRGSVVPPQAV